MTRASVASAFKEKVPWFQRRDGVGLLTLLFTIIIILVSWNRSDSARAQQLNDLDQQVKTMQTQNATNQAQINDRLDKVNDKIDQILLSLNPNQR